MKNQVHGKFEVRSANQEELMVEGYALKFEKPTLLFSFDGYEYYETIKRGAIAPTAFKNTVLNKNHDDSLILARTTNNSLECIVDDVGVFIRAKLLNTTSGRDYFQEIKSGLLDKMSFRWMTNDEESKQITTEENGVIKVDSQITKLRNILDVSAVVFPAYDDTEIHARSKERSKVPVDEIREQDLARRKKELLDSMNSRNKEFEEIKKIYEGGNNA